jgi:hypothetical protein
MRQRTKLRIEELENDIARFRASFSQREQTMIDEIHLLRNQNRQLKFSLEKIGHYALGELSGLEASSSQDSLGRDITIGDVQLGEDTSGTQSIPSHSLQSNYDVYSSRNETMGNLSNAARVESNWPTLPPLAGAFAGPTAGSGMSPLIQRFICISF